MDQAVALANDVGLMSSRSTPRTARCWATTRKASATLH